jgi:hypothetical protein
MIQMLEVWLETPDGQEATFTVPTISAHQIQAIADTDLFAVSVRISRVHTLEPSGVIDLTPNGDPSEWLEFLTDKPAWIAKRSEVIAR